MSDFHDPYQQRPDAISSWISDRQRLLRNETEDYQGATP